MNTKEFRFLLTPACNFRCAFCHAEGLKGTYKRVELLPEDVAFLYELGRREFGWRTTTLTGGEPTLFPGIRKTCILLYRAGAKITLQTNGSSLSERIEMVSYLSQLNISLHTMNPILFDSIICVPFEHENLLKNIFTVRRKYYKIPIHLNCVVSQGMNDTVEEVTEILHFAKSVSAVVKFIEITTNNLVDIVSIEFLHKTLLVLGFRCVGRRGLCEDFMHGDQMVTISRCDFGEAILSKKRVLTRDVFIASDGTFRPYANENVEINILDDIKNRDTNSIREKLMLFWGK